MRKLPGVEKLPWVDAEEPQANTASERNKELLDQLAGVTGLGWTTSVLAFFSSVLGYGNQILSRLVTEPTSFLYLGAVFFLATVGLERLIGREKA